MWTSYGYKLRFSEQKNNFYELRGVHFVSISSSNQCHYLIVGELSKIHKNLCNLRNQEHKDIVVSEIHTYEWSWIQQYTAQASCLVPKLPIIIILFSSEQRYSEHVFCRSKPYNINHIVYNFSYTAWNCVHHKSVQ